MLTDTKLSALAVSPAFAAVADAILETLIGKNAFNCAAVANKSFGSVGAPIASASSGVLATMAVEAVAAVSVEDVIATVDDDATLTRL